MNLVVKYIKTTLLPTCGSCDFRVLAARPRAHRPAVPGGVAAGGTHDANTHNGEIKPCGFFSGLASTQLTHTRRPVCAAVLAISTVFVGTPQVRVYAHSAMPSHYMTPAQEAHLARAEHAAREKKQTARDRLALAEREEHLKTRKWREASIFGAGPESMSSDDYETLHDVRRNIWTSGFRGLAAGMFVSAAGSVAYPMLQRAFQLSFSMEPRHRTASLLICSALGMAVGASTTGQQNAWRLTDIYTRGAKPRLTPYQKMLEKGRTGAADSDFGDDLEYDRDGSYDDPLAAWGYKVAEGSGMAAAAAAAQTTTQRGQPASSGTDLISNLVTPAAERRP